MLRHPHEIADRRSLVLHERVAERLVEDPSVRQRALARVEGWRRSGAVAKDYIEAWLKLLSSPLPEIVGTLRSRDEEATRLRQVSPFAGVLSPKERWELLRREKAEREQA